ncbi:MAG: S4 domain-containing protein, partial [Clostridia bacterium]
MMERLQKILSSHGIASRRAAEGMIEGGRVTVNGVTAILGTKADPATDEIAVDGNIITQPEELTYIMLNKP